MDAGVQHQSADVAATPPPSEPLVGEYQLVRRIGRGAMGEVWLARHSRTRGMAALKLLRDDRSRSKERMQRFFARERRAVARLSHPNVVPLFDVGPDYIAMRFIDGPTLARRLATPINPSVALDVAIQIASALNHAHACGVVHRDVKPSNILLDSLGNAYLADFGLAALLDDADPNEDGGGTPQYMAPEQARGEPPGPAADQFALGCVLAEMLAGTRVAPDPDAAAGAMPDSLPGEVTAIVCRAMALDPAHRWPSIEAFAAALRALDLTSAPTPQRLLPEVRVKAPFGWAAHHDAIAEIAPAISRVDYKLSTLEAVGAISPAAARAWRERTGYADFGWAVVGRTDRLGPLTDPRAYARAGELVLMIHGGMTTRESWMDIAAHVAQGNGQTLAFVPDVSGYGVSRYQRKWPRREHASAEGTLDGLLAWIELLGVRDLPLVLVGHSMGATALMTATDEQLGPRTWRLAVAPVIPAHDWQQRWGLRMLPGLGVAFAWVPGVKRLVGKLVLVWGPSAKAYARHERERMLEAFMQLPAPTFVRGAYEFSRARPAPRDQLARCAVVLAENDPVAPIERMTKMLARLEFPADQIHRLVAEGHVPHGEAAMHPEWTQRNIIELAAIIEQMLIASREGTVLPTQVASTLMSDNSSTASASTNTGS